VEKSKWPTEPAIVRVPRARSRGLARRSSFPFLQKIEDQFDAGRNAQLIVNPKKVVANDSGSTVLGFVAAFLALHLYRAQESVPLAGAAAFLPAALPLTDAALAILRRVRGNISLVKGDRLHFYDLLLAREWPARRVALVCYGITGIFCLAGWLATKCTYSWGFTISAITVGVFLVLEWRLGALQIPKPNNLTPEATILRLPNLSGNTKWPST
jgi:hypothetical protein